MAVTSHFVSWHAAYGPEPTQGWKAVEAQGRTERFRKRYGEGRPEVMPAVIAFSGYDEDVILVQEDVDQVVRALDHRSGFVELTRLPSRGQTFEPMTAWVNPARVAFLTDASPSR